MAEISEFNKKAEYKKIQEKLHEIKTLCKKENIPFFFAACIENDQQDSTYDLEMLSPEVCGVRLTKNWFNKFVDVTVGFDAVPPEKPIEMDADIFW